MKFTPGAGLSLATLTLLGLAAAPAARAGTDQSFTGPTDIEVNATFSPRLVSHSPQP